MGGDVAPRWNDGGTHNNRAVRHAECPGRDCPAYKVIFGTDYVTQEQEAQGRLLRDSIVEHLSGEFLLTRVWAISMTDDVFF